MAHETEQNTAKSEQNTAKPEQNTAEPDHLEEKPDEVLQGELVEGDTESTKVAKYKAAQAPVKQRGGEEGKDYNIRDISHPKKRALLNALLETGGNVTRSADAAKVDRRTHYDWLDKDPVYVQVFKKCKERAIDVLEAEAIRRAAEGVNEPVYYQGEVVGERKVYSDLLLMFLMKKLDPSYKDSHQQNVGIFGKEGQFKIEFNIPRPEE